MSTVRTADILAVADTGTRLVSSTTQYLSTLPHPIEIVEELIAVVSVTCSLLSTLHHTIERFYSLSLSPENSFLSPLEADLRFAFDSLKTVILEAISKKVFRPNDVGLVRVPRNAWALVCGGEAQAAILRSRLYVEKYRVRVLIDAVSWVGLRSIKRTRSGREDAELMDLTRMLPLVAERLVGVQRDYVPRLTGIPLVEEEKVTEVKIEEKKEAVKVEEKLVFNPPAATATKAQIYKGSSEPQKLSRKMSSSSTNSWTSSCSSSSSTTEFDNSISELWVLRRNEATETLTTRRSIFNISVSKKTTIKPATYYMKPMASTPSEIDLTIHESLAFHSASNNEIHARKTKKEILKLDEDAQWEIQKLIENRDKASSSNSIKRSWEVTAFLPKPRRKISAEGKTHWWKRNEAKNERRQWILVIKGDTVDCKTRTIPDKNSDPWAPAPAPKPVVKPVLIPQVQAQSQAQLQAQLLQRQAMAPVLRHVETRKGLSAEEAEKKMLEIVKDLFVSMDKS